MGVVRELLATLLKMFAADLWLTVTAVVAVAAAGLALRAGAIGAGALPFLLAAAILAALAVGVLRGARR